MYREYTDFCVCMAIFFFFAGRPTTIKMVWITDPCTQKVFILGCHETSIFLFNGPLRKTTISVLFKFNFMPVSVQNSSITFSCWCTVKTVSAQLATSSANKRQRTSGVKISNIHKCTRITLPAQSSTKAANKQRKYCKTTYAPLPSSNITWGIV